LTEQQKGEPAIQAATATPVTSRQVAERWSWVWR
jgi:hypothetical protein